MAIPEAQFEKLVESIKEEIVADIKKEFDDLLKKLSNLSLPSPEPFDTDGFKDELLDAVRQEFVLFKQELLADLPKPTQPAQPTQPTQTHSVAQPAKKTSWLDKKIL